MVGAAAESNGVGGSAAAGPPATEALASAWDPREDLQDMPNYPLQVATFNFLYFFGIFVGLPGPFSSVSRQVFVAWPPIRPPSLRNVPLPSERN